MAAEAKRRAAEPEPEGSDGELDQQLRGHAVLAYNEFVRAFQRRVSERIAANRVAIDLHLERQAQRRREYPTAFAVPHLNAWQNVARAQTAEAPTTPDRVRKTARIEVRTTTENVTMTRQVVMLPRIPPVPSATMWTAIVKNYDVEDQPDLQHKPYFGDDDDDDVVSEYYQLNRLQGTSTCEVDFIKDLCHGVLRQLMEAWDLSVYDLKVVARTIQVEPNVVIEVHKLIQNAPKIAAAKKAKTRNKESESASDVGYEGIVDTFRKFLCRRCYIYDCDYHPYNPEDVPKLAVGESNAIFNLAKTKDTERFKMARNCGNQCYLGQTQSSATLSKSRLVSSVIGWEAAQRALCERAYLVCGGNFCEMAKLLGDKTCLDVAEFCEYNGINDHKISVEHKLRSHPRRSHKKSKKIKMTPSISHLTQIESKERDGFPITITPCSHHGPCDDKSTCACKEHGWFCSKLCACVHEECKIYYRGCRCQRGRCRTKICPCFASGRECDLDLCTVCCEDLQVQLSRSAAGDDLGEVKSETSCQNRNLGMRKRKHVRVGRSTLPDAGWGLFVDDDVTKDEFIIEYTGEMVTQMEAERRGAVYDKLNRSYLFNLDTNTVIDATRKGNKTRFINHSKKPNCYPRIMNVNSDYRIGLYAARDIERHSELFFDYGYEKEIHDAHLHKQPTVTEWMMKRPLSR